MKLTATPPSYQIQLSDKINCFDFAANEYAYNLACIAVNKKIVIGIMQFPQESEIGFVWQGIKEISHEVRCHAISIAPETSLVVVPKVLNFCTAGADFQLRIFRSDLQDSNAVQVLQGHSSYINGVAWDPHGEFLASVSDDNTCILWDRSKNFESACAFRLSSAGMSVKWHPNESGKVLVAEMNGIIHLYNVKTQIAILSMETNKVPLMSADWSLFNKSIVTAIAGGDTFFWDMRRPSRPIDCKPLHEDRGWAIKFAPNSDVITASVGRPDNMLKVSHTKSNFPLIEAPNKLFGGLCWHYRWPYVAVGCDRKLSFWMIQAK